MFRFAQRDKQTIGKFFLIFFILPLTAIDSILKSTLAKPLRVEKFLSAFTENRYAFD
jgi:hypothetical protein